MTGRIGFDAGAMTRVAHAAARGSDYPPMPVLSMKNEGRLRMSARILHTSADGPYPGGKQVFGPRCLSPTLHVAGWLWLVAGLLVLPAGCGTKSATEETAEVSGKVLFKGQPLPGGRVSFVEAEGGLSISGNIDEKGNYKLMAPVGNVRISVDNEMLNKRRGQGGAMLKRPGSEAPVTMKGTYIKLPVKYTRPDTSGLTYTVKPEKQTFDIKLD
jgi:hypothetical protein